MCHSRRLGPVVAMAFLVLVPAAFAVQQAGKEERRDPAPATDELIRRLDSDKYEERDGASRALVRQGVSALPALEAACRQRGGLELRRRAESLIAEIKRVYEMELAHIWFDQLELVDLRKCRLVEVDTLADGEE